MSQKKPLATLIMMMAVLASGSAGAEVHTNTAACRESLLSMDATASHVADWILKRKWNFDDFSRGYVHLTIDSQIPNLSPQEKLEGLKLAASKSQNLEFEFKVSDINDPFIFDLVPYVIVRTNQKKDPTANEFQRLFRRSEGSTSSSLSLTGLSSAQIMEFVDALKRNPTMTVRGREQLHGWKDGKRSGSYMGSAMPYDFNQLTLIVQTLPRFISDSGFEDPQDIESFTHILTAYSEKNPHLLPMPWVRIAWDNHSDMALGMDILRFASQVHDAGMTIPLTSVQLIVRGMGYDPNETESYLERTSADTLKDFYKANLDLSEVLGPNIFKTVKIDPLIWERKNLRKYIRVLETLRNLFFLTEATPEGWRKVLEAYNLEGEGVSASNVDRLQIQIGKDVVKKVEEALGSHFAITYEQIENLDKRWNGIEPFVTLLARFKSNPAWEQEIPIVADIFRAVVENHFSEYKFGSKEQLGLLNEHALAEWTKVRSILRRSEFKNTIDNERKFAETIVANLHQIAANNLLPHLDLKKELPNENTRHEIISQILAEPEAPGRALKILMRSHKGEEILAAIASSISLIEDRNLLSTIVSFLKMSSQKIQFTSEVQADVLAMDSALRAQLPAKNASYLIFTTTFNDAKTLIRAGDLVNTSSCQNYRSGHLIGALPAYIIDGNIQGVASWVLTPNSFASVSEYNLVMKASDPSSENMRVVESRYNGDDSTIRLKIVATDASGIKTEKIITAMLPAKAHLRHMLKLGKTEDDKVGLVLEPAYMQSHPMMGEMQKQVQEIFNSLAASLDAQKQQKISLGTRNPIGAYSDLERGVKRGSLYTIDPTPKNSL